MKHSLFTVVVVTECISDHNDTNKHNNCLNLICALNVYLTLIRVDFLGVRFAVSGGGGGGGVKLPPPCLKLVIIMLET